jgi:hypothetical protein
MAIVTGRIRRRPTQKKPSAPVPCTLVGGPFAGGKVPLSPEGPNRFSTAEFRMHEWHGRYRSTSGTDLTWEPVKGPAETTRGPLV